MNVKVVNISSVVPGDLIVPWGSPCTANNRVLIISVERHIASVHFMFFREGELCERWYATTAHDTMRKFFYE